MKLIGIPAVNGKGNLSVPGVKLFKLENRHGLKMVLSSCGASMISLLMPDREGKMDDITLGYDDIDQYLADQYYMGSVVGRYANRIAGHTVTIDNTKYTLRSRHEGFHHHGGIEGFNIKIFDAVPFSKDGASGVVFTYTSADNEEGYPGEFKLAVTYTLTDNNEWIIEYKGLSDKTTIVNLTQHSYFNLAGHASGNIDQHYFQIFADYYLPVNTLQIPTGELAPVVGTAFDFTTSKQIVPFPNFDEQLRISGGYDHSFVLEREHTDKLKQAAVVYEPASGRRLEVWTTEPAVHFYSGNFLDNVNGREGATYRHRSGFCLETQHFPDSPNHPEFPSTILQAGEEFYSKTVFKFTATGL